MKFSVHFRDILEEFMLPISLNSENNTGFTYRLIPKIVHKNLILISFTFVRLPEK